MPETTLDALVAYFWEHGERYAPAVLCNHLVGQGYDPVLVDQASAAYQAERAQLVGPEPGAELSEAPGGRGGRTLRPFLIGLGVALGNFGLLLLSFRAAAATFSGADVHPQLTGARIGATLKLGLILFVCEVLGGFLLLLAGGRSEDPRSPGRNLGVGLLLGVVLTGVLFLLAIGVCFAVLG